MNRILLFAFLSISFFALDAQITVTVAPGYSQQVFYRLADDATTNVVNDDWDIAFSTIGLQDAGVHINESASFQFGATLPELEVYLTSNTWDDPTPIDPTLFDDSQRVYNDEQSWNYGGAFNQTRDVTNPFDFGWGTYDFRTNLVTGDLVFAIKMRDQSWKKFTIEGINITTYTFRYADLDGSNEVSVSFDKEDYAGSMAYFSFATGELLDNVPVNWDMMFTRYSTPIEVGGVVANYVVTGAINNHGIESALVSGVDPVNVDLLSYVDSLTKEIGTIGYDWKEFNSVWDVYDDYVYLIKDLDENYWKLYFTEFAGSGSGNITFVKEPLFLSSSTSEQNALVETFGVSPNPAQGNTQVVFEWEQSAAVIKAELVNLHGQVVRNYPLAVRQGLNAFTLNDLPEISGLYFLRISDGSKQSAAKLMIR